MDVILPCPQICPGVSSLVPNSRHTQRRSAQNVPLKAPRTSDFSPLYKGVPGSSLASVPLLHPPQHQNTRFDLTLYLDSSADFCFQIHDRSLQILPPACVTQASWSTAGNQVSPCQAPENSPLQVHLSDLYFLHQACL